MSSMKTDPRIQKLLRGIERDLKDDVRGIVGFGSRVRGHEHEASDYDLFIVFHQDRSMIDEASLRKLRALLQELAQEEAPVDLSCSIYARDDYKYILTPYAIMEMVGSGEWLYGEDFREEWLSFARRFSQEDMAKFATRQVIFNRISFRQELVKPIASAPQCWYFWESYTPDDHVRHLAKHVVFLGKASLCALVRFEHRTPAEIGACLDELFPDKGWGTLWRTCHALKVREVRHDGVEWPALCEAMTRFVEELTCICLERVAGTSPEWVDMYVY